MQSKEKKLSEEREVSIVAVLADGWFVVEPVS